MSGAGYPEALARADIEPATRRLADSPRFRQLTAHVLDRTDLEAGQ
jgi:hypothetical protein